MHRAEKKKNTLADLNYFYIEESKPCTSFCTGVMPFACTLHAQS